MNEVGISITSSLAFVADSFHLTGHWGWLNLLLLFAVSAVSIVPRPMLCVLAGSIYGLYGIPIALVGSMVGAAAAFLLGATLRGRTKRFLFGRRPTLQLVCEAVREEGWRIVLLCRLSPIAPSSVQSLLFGVSSIAFAPFALATVAGISPGITLEVLLGSGVHNALDGRLSHLQVGLFVLGLCAGFAALLLVGWKLREALRVAGATTLQSKQQGS